MSDPMTLSEYEHAAERTINASLAPDQRLLDASAGLAEEAGEVLGLVRKHLFQKRALDHDRLKEELGDALWCLTIAARAAGFELDEIARANIAKLAARHPDGFR
jgi:NTP pyrophosphatase (non-canonical NTP hydrolase)